LLQGARRSNWNMTFMEMSMRAAIALPFALLALSACHPQGDGNPKVANAKIRLPAVAGRPGAGYFTISGGARDDRLTRIDSAAVGKIEFHEMAMEGGMMRMRPLADVAVPKRTEIMFAPGGNHAMLFDIDKRITPGTGIPLLFTFASGTKVEVEAKTVAAGEELDGAAAGATHP